MKIQFILLSIFISILTGCSKNSDSTPSHGLNALISSYSMSIQSAPNPLAYSDITSNYQDSIHNYLWSNAPFINWEGTLDAIDTKDEELFGRKTTEVFCLIRIKIKRNIEGVFLLSFFKEDEPLTFNNLQECPIGSKVYFGFSPWQIRDDDQLQFDILNSEFNLRGGLFYIGTKPQSYSDKTKRIIAVYDSIRSVHPNEYIRIKDSLPTEFEGLPIEERVFINEFSSFRNLYDESFPRTIR